MLSQEEHNDIKKHVLGQMVKEMGGYLGSFATMHLQNKKSALPVAPEHDSMGEGSVGMRDTFAKEIPGEHEGHPSEGMHAGVEHGDVIEQEIPDTDDLSMEQEMKSAPVMTKHKAEVPNANGKKKKPPRW